MMDEGAYRRQIDRVFGVIDAAFETVDPDLAESMNSQGTLTVVFNGKSKLIVSPQAPTLQIWVAFRDRAWHMSCDAATGRWLDDRGMAVELYALIEELTRAETGQTIRIARSSAV